MRKERRRSEETPVALAPCPIVRPAFDRWTAPSCTLLTLYPPLLYRHFAFVCASLCLCANLLGFAFAPFHLHQNGILSYTAHRPQRFQPETTVPPWRISRADYCSGSPNDRSHFYIARSRYLCVDKREFVYEIPNLWYCFVFVFFLNKFSDGFLFYFANFASTMVAGTKMVRSGQVDISRPIKPTDFFSNCLLVLRDVIYYGIVSSGLFFLLPLIALFIWSGFLLRSWSDFEIVWKIYVWDFVTVPGPIFTCVEKFELFVLRPIRALRDLA